MNLDKSIEALVEKGLVEKVIKLGEIAPVEVMSLIQHYKGDGWFEGLTRECQSYTLLMSLVLKITGPCTTEEALNRVCVLSRMQAAKMSIMALDALKYPSGQNTHPPNFGNTPSSDIMLSWKGGSSA